MSREKLKKPADGKEKPKGRKFAFQPLDQMKEGYMLVLASNYVERKLGSDGTRRDVERVCSDPELLAEEVREEGVTSERSFQRVVQELESPHEIVRKTAADWLMMIEREPAIFGEDAAKKAREILNRK